MKTPIKCFPLAILIVFLSINSETFAQVGVGIASPNANAMLDLTTSTKGFLPPRLSTAQKTALGAQLLTSNLPEDKGMLVFDNDLNEFYFWNGLIWVGLASGNYVDLTSDQMMIGGMKTFTNGVTVNGMLKPEGRLMLPMGEISYFDYPTGFTVDITQIANNTSNMIKINPSPATFINDGLNSGFTDGTHSVTNNRLTYTGATARYFHIALSFAFSMTGNQSDSFVFGVAQGSGAGAAAVKGSSLLFNRANTSADVQSSAMHVLLKLEQNDYIEFWVGNLTDSDDIIIKSMNFVAIGM